MARALTLHLSTTPRITRATRPQRGRGLRGLPHTDKHKHNHLTDTAAARLLPTMRNTPPTCDPGTGRGRMRMGNNTPVRAGWGAGRGWVNAGGVGLTTRLLPTPTLAVVEVTGPRPTWMGPPRHHTHTTREEESRVSRGTEGNTLPTRIRTHSSTHTAGRTRRRAQDRGRRSRLHSINNHACTYIASQHALTLHSCSGVLCLLFVIGGCGHEPL